MNQHPTNFGNNPTDLNSVPVPIPIQVQSCLQDQEPVTVDQRSVSSKFDLDRMITISPSLSKTTPKKAEKFITVVKEVLIELLETNEMFACKFKLTNETSYFDEDKLLTPFQIEIIDPEERGLGIAGGWAFRPREYNKIQIVVETYNKEDKKKYFQLKTDIAEILMHEFHHAIVGASAVVVKNENDRMKLNFRLKALPGEAIGPYANEAQRKEFAAVLLAGEIKIQKLMDKWLAVKLKKADKQTIALIEKFKKEVSNYNPEKKYYTQHHLFGYCPLIELLTQLKKSKSRVEKNYQAYYQQLWDWDAHYHQYLTEFSGLFKHLFGDLLKWHEDNLMPEYRECVNPVKARK